MNNNLVSNDLTNWQELLPFINKVFKKNFVKLMPKIYTEDKYLPHHYIIRENNKIIANVASLPSKIILPDCTLEGRGIGMVAVNKKCRGRRLMDTLMSHCVKDANDENVDFMFLSGNRKRYEKYGFQPLCTTMNFRLIKENARHSGKVSGFEFIKVKADSPYILKIEQLYNQQAVRYERKEFFKILRNWNTSSIFAILKDGELVGHIISKGMVVVEINVISVPARDVILAYFEQVHALPFLDIKVFPNRLDIMSSLAEICQYHSCEACNMVNIVNYKSVISKLLSAETSHLSYIFILEIEDNCKIRISSKEGKYLVEDAEGLADIVLPKVIANTILVSPQLAAGYGLPFYLKLFLPNQDNV